MYACIFIILSAEYYEMNTLADLLIKIIYSSQNLKSTNVFKLNI